MGSFIVIKKYLYEYSLAIRFPSADIIKTTLKGASLSNHPSLMDFTVELRSFGNMNNSTVTPLRNEYDCKPFASDTAITKGVKVLSYCILLLLSVLGNSSLIAIIKRNRRMQTITNYLIANMAVSDILITLLAVPRQITEIIIGPRRWLIEGVLGSVLCKSAYFVQDITVAALLLYPFLVLW